MNKLRISQLFSILAASTLIAVLLVTAVLYCSALALGAWNLQTVDPAEVWDTSIAVDSNGYPHISYYSGGLKYARWNGSTWMTETVDPNVTVGQYNSIALDSNNRPHISYWSNVPFVLKHARWTGAAWDIGTVDDVGNVGRYTSIALDTDDNPHISYYDDTFKILKYARWTGLNWDIVPIANMGNGGQTSIALDSSNRPHISYCVNYAALKYVSYNGASWIGQIVDPTVNVGMYNSLALDSSNRPHISYEDATNRTLKYARWNGSSWSIETVDSSAEAGNYTSIALDNSNQPHISYTAHGNLKYASWTGSGWTIETVDTPPPTLELFYTSLSLYRGSYPNISYATGSSGSLHYAFIPAPPPPTVSAINPDIGQWGQSLPVMISGSNFTGATAVGFGPGVTVNSFTVDNAGQITANISIAMGAAPGARDVSVTTPGGIAILTGAFKALPLMSSTGSGSSSSSGAGSSTQTPTVTPVAITVQSATLSAKSVTPGTPVTVTADIANRSTSNGSKKVTLYVNGQVETTQGVAVNSGGSSKLTFNIYRSEPGDYTVYVDGVPAGSFKVELFRESDGILIFSAVLIAIALIFGLILLRRRQRIYN